MLDDELIREAMQYSRVRTKRAVVAEALQAYIVAKREERRRATYRDRLAGVRAQAAKTPVRTSAHALIRSDRERVR